MIVKTDDSTFATPGIHLDFGDILHTPDCVQTLARLCPPRAVPAVSCSAAAPFARPALPAPDKNRFHVGPKQWCLKKHVSSGQVTHANK